MVKITDRKREIELVRMALNFSGVSINYEQTDLFLTVMNEVKKKKGNFSIKDGSAIQIKWARTWEEYYRRQEEETKRK
jgi:hypothetical protein